MAYNSANRSERLLQNRRFTTDGITLSQEAFTSVLDINASEIYTQQNFIPTASAAIPFSGSSQNGLIVSASVVQPGISPDLPILKYWYRKKMKPAADGTQQVYYFTTSDPATPTSTVTSDQLIESDQQTSFISPKYIRSADSSFNSEANPPGYKVIVYKSTSATAAGITEAASLDSTYVFDYKTGVLSWITGNTPTSNQYVYITAYQYVGKSLDTSLTGGGGGGGVASGDKITTGSITASVNIGANVFTIVSGSSTFFNISSAGLVTVPNLTVNENLVVNGTASFINSENLVVKDKFILINSGSTTLTDSGWISQYNAAGSGSAFYLDADTTGTYGRFAVAFDVTGGETIVAANEYVVTARQASGAPAATPTWGGSTNGFGNMYINSDNGDIFIYS